MSRLRPFLCRRGPVLAWLLAALPVLADGVVEEARLYRQEGWVRVEVRAGDLLDARTASTVDSGLPGTCVYSLRLVDPDERAVAERILELSLLLDLWENRYILDGPRGRHVFATLAAADSAWSHIDAVDLCRGPELSPGLAYRLHVQIAVQPLAPEVRQQLSRYVSSHSSRNREELSLDLGALFGRILGGGSAGKDHVRYTSPPFRAADLEVRP